MKHATLKPTPADLFDTLVSVAREWSQESRSRLAAEVYGTFSTPAPRWHAVVAGRRADSRLTVAARLLGKLVKGDRRERIRVAFANAVQAIRELAAWVPEFVEEQHVMEAADARRYRLGRGPLRVSWWTPTPASLARLDELRRRVRVRLVEAQEMMDDAHPDAFARFAAIAARVAVVVLPQPDADLVTGWLAKFAAAEPA